MSESEILSLLAISKDIAKEIIKLLNDQALRTTIANNAYKLLKNHGFLSVDKVVEDTINVYDIVLNGGKNV